MSSCVEKTPSVGSVVIICLKNALRLICIEDIPNTKNLQRKGVHTPLATFSLKHQQKSPLCSLKAITIEKTKLFIRLGLL